MHDDSSNATWIEKQRLYGNTLKKVSTPWEVQHCSCLAKGRGQSNADQLISLKVQLGSANSVRISRPPPRTFYVRDLVIMQAQDLIRDDGSNECQGFNDDSCHSLCCRRRGNLLKQSCHSRKHLQVAQETIVVAQIHQASMPLAER